MAAGRCNIRTRGPFARYSVSGEHERQIDNTANTAHWAFRPGEALLWLLGDQTLDDDLSGAIMTLADEMSARSARPMLTR